MPFLETGSARIFFQNEPAPNASAPVLVLSNSLGTDLHMWDAQVEDLKTHFQVLRYDTRGQGQSRIDAGTTNFAELGGDVLQLLDHHGIARAHFCGLSMGGITGMWLGAHAPERIQRLVLCNTAARIGPASIWDQRIAAVLADGMQSITPAVMARWFTPAFALAHRAAVEPIERMLLATPAQGYAASCLALRDADLNADLKRISASTLVIAGEADRATTVGDAQSLTAAIRGARVEILPAAHLSNIEACDQFNRAVLNFLLE